MCCHQQTLNITGTGSSPFACCPFSLNVRVLFSVCPRDGTLHSPTYVNSTSQYVLLFCLLFSSPIFACSVNALVCVALTPSPDFCRITSFSSLTTLHFPVSYCERLSLARKVVLHYVRLGLSERQPLCILPFYFPLLTLPLIFPVLVPHLPPSTSTS